ncbi:MAG: tetratricopeptide repeat protein, partial [candidate division Zixibacteria bacterium]|nr:tetratricopeptide repeat protein [candidate division Zixibacteria bacterium]
ALNTYINLAVAFPKFAPARAAMFRLYTILGEPDAAFQAARVLLQLKPNDLSAALAAAEASLLQKKPDQALQMLRSLQPSREEAPVIKFATARIHNAANRLDSARSYATAALSAPAELVEYYVQGANYLEEAGLLDSAMIFSRRAVALSDGSFEVALNHFFRALRTQYLYDARSIMDSLADAGAGDLVNAGLDRYYYSGAGKAVQARLAGETLRYLDMENLSLAILGNLSHGIRSDPLASGADMTLVEKIFASGGFSQEIQDYVSYLLAITFSKSGENIGALQYLDRLKPPYLQRLDVQLTRIGLYNMSGQFDKFDEGIPQLLSKYPNNPELLVGVADVCADWQIRKLDLAEKYYRQALELDRWCRPAFDSLRELLAQRNRVKDAIQLFGEYPHFEERFPEAAVAKSILLVKNGETEAGVALFVDRIGYLKGKLSYFEQLIDVLNDQSSQADKSRIVQLLHQTNPDNHDALILAARYLSDDKEYSAALELTERVLAEDPGDIGARVQQARAWYWLGDRDEAFDLFEAVLEDARDDCDANYYFSNILAHEKIDLNRAANLARNAQFQSDRGLKYKINVSYVYFQGGRYDLSRAEATKAIKSHGDRPEGYFRMGMALYVLGDAKTKSYLEKAIELGLKGDDLETARETLVGLK